MKLFTELKLTGDAYPGGFSTGLSMHGSATMDRFVLRCGNEDLTEGTAEYESSDGLKLILSKTADGKAFRVKTTIINGSDHEICMELLTSFALDGIQADKVHRLQSFWSAEGKLRTETVDDIHLEPSWAHFGMRVEKFGNTGSMPVRKYFPFLALEDSESGTFTAFQLCIASTWQMEIISEKEDTLTVTGGIGDRDFGHWMKTLAPGESFETPEALITTGSSLYEVCDTLVKAQHPLISPVDDDMGIMFNEYCATWGDPSYDKMAAFCEKLEGKGIKFFVIDSGWYGADKWWESIGDWEVNEDKFPGGMKPVADLIRSKGMIPGIWFEMEALAPSCKHYNEKEHLLCKDGVPLTVGTRRFWDMEDPWVIQYLSEKVIGLLKTSGFGYVKLDYNDTVGIGCDGCESLGEGLRRKVKATQDFFKKIREEIPGIVIENCSSGGHRLEPSMMSLCSQASFSDAHETPSIPLIAANMHRVIRPDQCQIWAVLRASDTRRRIEYSLIATLFGRMCMSGDISDLSDEQWKAVDEGMAFYRKCTDVIKYGKTVLIDQPDTKFNALKGQQLLIREYNGTRLAILHRFEDSVFLEPDMDGCELIAEYGSGDSDLSAKAWLYRA